MSSTEGGGDRSKKDVYRHHGVRLDSSGLSQGFWDPAKLPPGRAQFLLRAVRGAQEEFRGITTDGIPIAGMFGRADEGFETEALCIAVRCFLDALSPEQRRAASEPIESYRRRLWVNGFPAYTPHGLLLDAASEEVRERAMDIVRHTFSDKGFSDIRATMKLNALLGALVGDGGRNLTEWMYRLTIFGEPSSNEPWGWQLMGHHLDLNIYVEGRQIVATPCFLGAEPRISDELNGPFAGVRAFDEEEAQGLAMMQSLDWAQRERATLYRSALVKDLPEELAGRIDGRHRTGVAQDNRILPYEGVAARDLKETQRQRLADLIDLYNSRLTSGPRAARKTETLRWLDETYFSWIGDTTKAEAPFYYKIHSPVQIIEFDHHMGVFLDNEEAERFHTHTIVRTPNGGDYGMALLRQAARVKADKPTSALRLPVKEALPGETARTKK